MRCPKCGKQAKEGRKTCARCGAPLQKKRLDGKWIALIAAAAVLLGLALFLLLRPSGDDTDSQPLHHVQITVKDYGTVTLELDASAAPITVQNFLDLANSGFYDGLTFHRIMDGFMIQGGDPDGNGTGGSGTNIKGEFSANGWDNPISHRKGVISMARAKPYDSASSQFFICVADATSLDGQYAAFGHVTEGMEIVEQIAKDARPIDNNGTIPADQQPVIESIKVID
jgi:peptidyl-prolyl cis-trans isomerase B (cyclophilin B)